ncbi:MAG: hypothetical protein QOF62_284 [Pyrinomonadaceae bacterium]|jgi:hypothetical protein|nr:hypothetical protein [Pyrinomonadaceae bacterium]
MHIVFLASVLLSHSIIPASVNTWFPQSTSLDKSCQIRKIYIAEFDESAASLNFRRRLGKRLSKKFVIMAKPDEADAILTGEFSALSGSGYSYVTFEHAELKTANGQLVWHGDFDLKLSNSLWGLGNGHIGNAAMRIAKDILNACK